MDGSLLTHTRPTEMKPRTALLAAILGIAIVSSIHAQAAPSGNLADVTYEKDIRPILKAHCFHCHGEDGVVEAGLDLRLRRFMIDGGDSGASVVPSDVESSLLVDRIVSGEMPPEDKLLSDEEVQIIEAWIRDGAIAELDEPEHFDEAAYFTKQEREFWSFRPIAKHPVPDHGERRDLENPIDAFVLRRLHETQLDFSPVASKRVLIRRVYFDLLGLPPSPAEVQTFLEDRSPAAYANLVDRLLASPRYGERWGRHWLDVAGYADSEGYVDSDPVRDWSYRYRDYVIDSFNEGVPFDQFVVEQLAGDELVSLPYRELSEADNRRLTATGFLRLAPDGTVSGDVDQSVARNEVISDTINIMGTSMLGLTIGCARCHNHRYDPISQRDYYQLRAVFEPALDWKAWRSKGQKQISLYGDEDRAIAAEIEAKAKAATDERARIQAEHIQRTLYEELIKAPDDLKEALRSAYETTSGDRTEAQIALLKEYPSIQNISNGSLYLYSEQRKRRADEIAAVADQKEREFVSRVCDATVAEIEPELREVAARLIENLPEELGPIEKELLQRFPALQVSGETLSEFDPEGSSLVAEYRAAAEKCRTTDHKKQLADLQAEINEIRATIPTEHFIRALTEPANHQPETVVFIRGNHTQPGEVVEPAHLSILQIESELPAIQSNDPSLPTTGRRLAFAKNLTSGEHPLLARVLVNRVWMHHFGEGLVRTPGDFGQLGERPTHPALLDWLARDFMESGWQLKSIQRAILLSRTYQQSSLRTEKLDDVDPENRLLGRQTIRRLESETIRDSMLLVSGELVDTMHGPPVPVMEDSVGQIVIGREDLDGERKPKNEGGLGAEERRRSLYVQVRRSRPLATLETFDLASVAPNCVERPSSNVATQSLMLMNSSFVIQQAESFAARVIRESGGDLDEQIRHAWMLAYGESPSDDEAQSLRRFVEAQEARFSGSGDASEQAHRKALAIACQAILAANQFIYVD